MDRLFLIVIIDDLICLFVKSTLTNLIHVLNFQPFSFDQLQMIKQGYLPSYLK